jgi:hypothetical protein
MSVLDFTGVKAINIPEGKVKKITRKTDGALLWEAVTSRIPGEYQEVEWIQAGSSVGAYISLGLNFDTAARVKLGMYCVDTTPSYIFGAAESSGKYRCMISAPYGGGRTAYAYGSNGSSYVNITVALVAGFNDLEYTLKSGTFSLKNATNGGSYTASNTAFKMTSNLLLFAQNYNGSVRYGAYRKIAYFEYYDKNDTLLCSLIPCYRKSDGVIGMYDAVRKLFLTNVGSGSFTKGGNV